MMAAPVFGRGLFLTRIPMSLYILIVWLIGLTILFSA